MVNLGLSVVVTSFACSVLFSSPRVFLWFLLGVRGPLYEYKEPTCIFGGLNVNESGRVLDQNSKKCICEDHLGFRVFNAR